jgi:tetratricopeptide (TPR) repeat protein
LNQEQTPYPYNLKDPGSLAEARKLILSQPTNAPYHLALVRLLENRAPLLLQARASESALYFEPKNPYIRDDYASALIKMGNMDQGLKELARSIADAPFLDTHSYLSAGSLASLPPAEQKAVEDGFTQAVARQYRGALENLAAFYANLGRFSDQGSLYEQAAARETDARKRTAYLLNAGRAYAGAQNDAKAELLFRETVAAAPDDLKGYHYLATAVYGPRKDLETAKQVVADGVQHGAPPLSLYLSLAEAAQKAGSPEETKAALEAAKDEVRKSSKNGEDPFPLYLLLADGARNSADRQEEAAALSAALELRPRSLETLNRLGHLYLEQGNLDRAALYFGRMANLNPDAPDVFYQLARAEEGRYRFADADKAYARALELAPHNKEARSRYEAFKQRIAQHSNEARIAGAK